jgi:hypothetical protein
LLPRNGPNVERIASIVSNALLVVTGYFPIVSKGTPKDLVLKLIQAFLGISKANEIERSAKKHQQKQMKRARKLNDANLMQSDWLIDRLAQLSSVWKTRSDADLQAAVDAVNSSANSPRRTATFVKVTFADDECYAAHNTNLWEITGSSGGAGHFVTDDQMFSQRGKTCELIQANLNARTQLICPIAGTGHPNSVGSKKYADAILDTLSTILPEQARE